MSSNESKTSERVSLEVTREQERDNRRCSTKLLSLPHGYGSEWEDFFEDCEAQWEVTQRVQEWGEATAVGSPNLGFSPREAGGAIGSIDRVARNVVRALRAGGDGALTVPEWRALVRSVGGCCVYCGHDQHLVVEHVVPISRGGDTSAENVAPACRRCNQIKGGRDPWEFLASSPERAANFAQAVRKANGLEAA